MRKYQTIHNKGYYKKKKKKKRQAELSKVLKLMKNKERLKNCHQLEETAES